MGQNCSQKKVNISLGGIAFKSEQQIKEQTLIKTLIFTKPKMVPIIVDGTVVYSQYQNENYYRTAIEFNRLSKEQELLLSQHIMQVQIKRAD